MEKGVMFLGVLWLASIHTVYGYGFDLRFLADELSREDIQKGCDSNPADIVFALDESGSIWGPDFDKQKDFVKDVVRLFNVGYNRTHIGVVTFGTDVKVHFNLGQHTEEDELHSAIDRIGQRRGQTRTDLVLQTVCDRMFSRTLSRPWASHLAIVITDGVSDYADRTARQAQCLKDAGIITFAIGVGDRVNRNELLTIAIDKDHMYTVTSYTALEDLMKVLAWKACLISTLPPPTTTTTTTTTTTPTTTLPQSIPGCEHQMPVDVVFSVPGTADVRQSAAAHRLIKATLNEVLFGPHQVQAGLAPRRWDVEVENIRLMDHDTKESYFEELDRHLPGQPTKLVSQMLYMIEHAFTEEHGGRDSSAKVGVVMIDRPIYDMAMAQEVAMAAKDLKVQLIYIGIGKRVIESQLRLLADDPDTDIALAPNILLSPDYESLYKLAGDLRSRLCEAIVKALYSAPSYFSIQK